MKVMGLWQDDLCPCCRQIPERSTTHLFLCPAPEIRDLRQTLFTTILEWLTEVNTDPLIVQVISSLWYGTNLQLPDDPPIWYRTLYNNMREISVQSMWMRFLPIDLIHHQGTYYKLSGSRRNGGRWGEQFVGKMLRTTLQLWLKRNSMVHSIADNGIDGMDLIQLREAVAVQLEIAEVGLPPDDHYLLEKTLDDVMNDSVEDIRGWLCNMYIA